jgi:hypothetical protein
VTTLLKSALTLSMICCGVPSGATPKGRQVDPQALAEIRALLGERERRRDLLIEHLHLIQDRYEYLSAAHLAALAHEMRLALAEVYEVATFYAHFDVVKEGQTPPPAVAARQTSSFSSSAARQEARWPLKWRHIGRDERCQNEPILR